ncbi:MAG TPA: lectin-like protein [Polyangia bacterium]
MSRGAGRTTLACVLLAGLFGCATGVPPAQGGDSGPPDDATRTDTTLPTDSPIQTDGPVLGDAPAPEDKPPVVDAPPCPAGYTGAGCADCADGYHACGSGAAKTCETDRANQPANGCRAGCAGACPASAHETATCTTEGACATTCAPGYGGVGCATCDTGYRPCGADCVAACSACNGKTVECDGACVASCTACTAKPVACDGVCIASCAGCTGRPATCAATSACLAACAGCTGTCLDCPAGFHACPGGCQADAADTPEAGCKNTCTGTACAVPDDGAAVCTAGACDFTCNTDGGFRKAASGVACVCDTAGGFVEDTTVHVCVCRAELKACAATCEDPTDPAHGCRGAACDACPTPAHGAATCNGAAGACDFDCDAAGHYVKSGSACVCDAAGHWEANAGGACVCASGYALIGGSCQVPPPCPGTMFNGHCYWYVASAAAWAAAETACAVQQGHLASITDTAENTFVKGLAAGDAWFGLHDPATVKQSVRADDCRTTVWLDSNGGTFTGSNDQWNDVSPGCGAYDSSDEIFGLRVTAAPQLWVLSLSNSNYDTILGLFTRVDNASGYTTCIGPNLACDDDGGAGTRSKIVRQLDPGDYALVVDGYDGAYGNFSLDVRRFVFTDGTVHTWQSWRGDEPNNSGGNEYCGEIYKSDGTWNDLRCTNSLPYVCERPY